MRKNLLMMAAMLAMTAMPLHAENDELADNSKESEFVSEEKLEEGFLTHYLNEAVAKGMNAADAATEVEYGRKITKYVSAPKFGAYFIGKYDYTDKDGTNTNGGFSQRYIRLYVDGTILGDFAYRVQLQTNNASFHVKDFFLEWQKYKEFRVKIGQFKRAFTFENPMNPWDVGAGEYSQAIKMLAGMGDYCGEPAASGGRDQGLQVQGDLFPVGNDGHRLVHYQLMVANGQGVNTSDTNKKKDIIGTIQFQPVKGLFLGFFGWSGDYTEAVNFNGVTKNVTVGRNRYAISGKYDANDWTVRAEYIHSTGHRIKDYSNTTNTFSGNGKADAWYATVGIPCTPWLKTFVKYDVYRSTAEWGSARSMYSIIPHFQLHKNLMFQLQYNYVNDRLAADRHYNEIWCETYVRF